MAAIVDLLPAAAAVRTPTPEELARTYRAGWCPTATRRARAGPATRHRLTGRFCSGSVRPVATALG